MRELPLKTLTCHGLYQRHLTYLVVRYRKREAQTKKKTKTMRKKKVTMLDIANAVGVSQPTVSIILNDPHNTKVSNETRRKVLDKAQELGYRVKSPIPHTQSHRRIALLVNSMNMHDPFINAISAAKIRAWELDALLVLYDYEDNDELKHKMMQDITESHYHGLIFASNTPQHVDDILELPIPCVFLNCCNPHAELSKPCILTSDFLGGYKATQHLIDRGYTAIAMITGETWDDSSAQREKGFRQALTNADILVNEHWIRQGNWSVKQSFLQARELLNPPKQPQAIFCASDLMAIGVYQAIGEKGLSIPDDIAVIGYDNQLIASQLTPSLTSVDLPYDEMGKTAVELILSPNKPDILLLKTEGDLIIRESTR